MGRGFLGDFHQIEFTKFKNAIEESGAKNLLQTLETLRRATDSSQ